MTLLRRLLVLFAFVFATVGVAVTADSPVASAYLTNCQTFLSGGGYSWSRCNDTSPNGGANIQRVRVQCYNPSTGVSYTRYGAWVGEDNYSSYDCPNPAYATSVTYQLA